MTVTKSNGELIRPFKETPSGSLPLSTIDKIYITGLFIETLHVFNKGRDPAKIIKQALSKALVVYYPLAGRLTRSEKDGELQVECTGDGVWFVEAFADCSLEDANWLQHPPLRIPKEQLLPFHSDPAGMIYMFQVTQFSCGGFVVGIMTDHSISDGIGTVEFLNTIADFTRGSTQPTINPIWSRDTVIPKPPKVSPPLPPINSGDSNQYFSVDIPLDRINRLKKQYHDDTSRHCSTFDILSALAWQGRSRARAMDSAPDAETRLIFAANIRHLLKETVGYYGNCIYPVTITEPSRKIVHATVAEVVSRIRDAKGRLPAEFSSWAKGELTVDPFQPGFGAESVYMADWTRLGFTEVDYGWGKPEYIVPLIESVPSAVAFIMKSGKKGVRLITQCVMEHQMKEFQDQIEKFA